MLSYPCELSQASLIQILKCAKILKHVAPIPLRRFQRLGYEIVTGANHL